MYQEVSQILKGMEGRALDSVQQFSCRLEVASVRQSLDMLLWIVLATLSTTKGLSISWSIYILVVYQRKAEEYENQV